MKCILAVCAFMFSTTSAFADFIDCRRDDASIAGGAAASARVGDHDIVKSWMPTQIWIDEEKNEYGTSYHEAPISRCVKIGMGTNCTRGQTARTRRTWPMP